MNEVTKALQRLSDDFRQVDRSGGGFISVPDYYRVLERNGCRKHQGDALLPSCQVGSGVNYGQLLRFIAVSTGAAMTQPTHAMQLAGAGDESPPPRDPRCRSSSGSVPPPSRHQTRAPSSQAPEPSPRTDDGAPSVCSRAAPTPNLVGYMVLTAKRGGSTGSPAVAQTWFDAPPATRRSGSTVAVTSPTTYPRRVAPNTPTSRSASRKDEKRFSSLPTSTPHVLRSRNVNQLQGSSLEQNKAFPVKQEEKQGEGSGAHATVVSLRDVFNAIASNLSSPAVDKRGDVLVPLAKIHEAFARQSISVSPAELEAVGESLDMATPAVPGATSRHVSLVDFCVLVSRLRPMQIDRIRRAPWKSAPGQRSPEKKAACQPPLHQPYTPTATLTNHPTGPTSPRSAVDDVSPTLKRTPHRKPAEATWSPSSPDAQQLVQLLRQPLRERTARGSPARHTTKPIQPSPRYQPVDWRTPKQTQRGLTMRRQPTRGTGTASAPTHKLPASSRLGASGGFTTKPLSSTTLAKLRGCIDAIAALCSSSDRKNTGCVPILVFHSHLRYVCPTLTGCEVRVVTNLNPSGRSGVIAYHDVIAHLQCGETRISTLSPPTAEARDAPMHQRKLSWSSADSGTGVPPLPIIHVFRQATGGDWNALLEFFTLCDEEARGWMTPMQLHQSLGELFGETGADRLGTERKVSSVCVEMARISPGANGEPRCSYHRLVSCLQQMSETSMESQ